MSENLFGMPYDGWVAIFTALLTVATSILGYFTYKLWKSTSVAVNDAGKSIEIAQQSLLHAQQATKKELRAYVVAEVSKFSDVEAQKQPRGFVDVHNVGRTPAYNVGIDIDIIIGNQAFTPKLPEPEEVVRTGMTLGPGKSIQPNAKINISLLPAGVDAIKTEEDAIYIFGCIVYDDIFDETHRAQFCHFYRGSPLTGRYQMAGNIAD